MFTKATQFLAVVLTALALLPGGAHLMSLPAKISMPEDPYFVAQQVYRGWAWAGVVIFLAIFVNFAAAFLTHGRRRQLFAVAGLLIAATLALFFVWTYPANQATGNWTSVPENWEQLRIQWEYSHAVNAALTFLALLCAVGAALSTDLPRETDRRNTTEENAEAQDQLTAQSTPRLESVASTSTAADKIVYPSPSPQAQQRRMR
jgi:MFS family permease